MMVRTKALQDLKAEMEREGIKLTHKRAEA